MQYQLSGSHVFWTAIVLSDVVEHCNNQDSEDLLGNLPIITSGDYTLL